MCRGIVAIAALVAFITFFFTVTSTGKAWAKQLYNFILTVRDGGYTISPEVPYDFPAVDYEEKHYSSYEEFEKDTGYKAYKFKNTLGLPVEDIMAVKSNSGFSLYTTFILSDGNRICIYQQWQIASILELFQAMNKNGRISCLMVTRSTVLLTVLMVSSLP